MKHSLTRRIGAALVLIMMVSASASATAIMKFSLGNQGPDVAYTEGVFSTVDDGDASTTGDQNSSIRFVGILSFMDDILSGASFSLADVMASGSTMINSGVVSQSTMGGTFEVYDDVNVLLLSGSLGAGMLSGGLESSTGSYFNTTFATFNGGTLMSYIAPTPGALSVALSGILSDSGIVGMAPIVGCEQDCQLRNFNASADQLIDGQPVPEPGALLLLTTGIAGAIMRRRKSKMIEA